MSRYDKYEPYANGFRALLAADFTTTTEFSKLKVVSLDATGKVVIGTAGQSGFAGCLILAEKKFAGDVVDIMTSGEVVDFTLTGGGAAAAGTPYYALADGTYDAVAPGAGVNKPFLGFTVEATRLVVRTQRHQG